MEDYDDKAIKAIYIPSIQMMQDFSGGFYQLNICKLFSNNLTMLTYIVLLIFFMLTNRKKMTMMTSTTTLFFVVAIFAMAVFLISTLPFAFAYSTISSSDTANTNSITNNEIPIQVKNFILDQIVHKSKAAIVIGFVDSNGTRIFSFGNMSTAHNIPVSENTLFDIGSITKTFTTLLLADMVKQGTSQFKRSN